MVKDRLHELQRNCDVQHSTPLRDSFVNIEIDTNSLDYQICQILVQFSDLRDGIAEIKENVKKMRALMAEIIQSFNGSKSLTERMEKMSDGNLAICNRMFSKMKELEIGLPWKDDFSTIARIKRTNFFCIRDDFLNAWREHEQFLVLYEEKIKKALIRHAKIVDSNITDEETESLIANKTTSLFVGNILEETEEARQHLRQLLVRHTELAKIERSIMDVRDMFLRISSLIMEQSALVQVVEYHAQQASMHLDKGTDELEKARDHKIKSLKRKTCILIWIAIVLSVLIFILIAF